MSIDPVSLAITAAVTAVNLAVAASRTIEGPRLKDTSATVADYGTPLNYLVGQRVIPTPCFFAKPILEKKKKRKGKSGKQVEYSGFATWAAHIADHEIAGVSKIWFDNHLVYNATGDEVELYPLAEDYELEANIRIYLGTEDQEPDPDMLAYIEARDGPGTCPAYRGTSYIYFENIPVEMVGNRFPSVTVLARKASPPIFRGWYARAVVTILSTDASFPGNSSGFFIQPGNGVVQLDKPEEGSFYSGTESEDFPDGIPVVRYLDNYTVEFYWVDPDVMDCTNIHLRLQFQAGSIDGTMPVSFSWQFWDGDPASPPAGPGSDTSGNPFNVGDLFPLDWFFAVGSDSDSPPSDYDAGPDTYATLEQLLNFVSARAGLDLADYDWSATSEITFGGYNWTQGTGRQILDPILDLFDVDVRPHDFILEALPRGNASVGAIATGEMVREREGGGIPYQLKDAAPGDLPRRVFLTYADLTTDQNPNVAMPPAAPSTERAGTMRELSVDMQTLALEPTDAQRLVDRYQRRLRVGRTTAEFSVTRQLLGLEPGDVWTPYFDDRAWSMRNRKLTIGANGVIGGDWERDMAALAILSTTTVGAPAQGHVPDVMPSPIATLGLVMDLPLLVDAHDQSAPLAYLVAGPGEPGVWTGADFAQSETGELDSYTSSWAGVASGDGSIIGTVGDALPDAVPWVADLGSSITVTLNVGELTSATLDELLVEPTLNLAAIRSGDGWELVQFMSATLVGELTYEVTGFLRGVRGTEWAMAGHQVGDEFVLLSEAAVRTMGAAEIGDTDWYIAAPTGQTPDQDDAFAVTFTGASHKPLAPVYGTVELDESSPGAGDVLFNATRRTRIGGATLDGQDVPLGETAESWVLDILDNGVSPVAVKRTITSSSLPIIYTEAQQIADWGAPLSASSPIMIPEANLYQVSPPLTLRGYPLNFPEQSL